MQINSLNDFNTYRDKNPEAMSFLSWSYIDYMSARCCIIYGGLYLSGCVLGAQAIEKVLKSTLLFHDSKTDVKRFKHKLSKIASELDTKYQYQILKNYGNILNEFEKHYNTKYPYETNSITAKSNEDLDKLDDIYFNLLEKMKIPEEVRYFTNIYGNIFNPSYKSSSEHKIITSGNKTLQLEYPVMEMKYQENIKKLKK